MIFVIMKNVGGHYETWNTGILGPVVLHGLDQGKWDLSWQKWTYQVNNSYFCSSYFSTIDFQSILIMAVSLNRLV